MKKLDEILCDFLNKAEDRGIGPMVTEEGFEAARAAILELIKGIVPEKKATYTNFDDLLIEGAEWNLCRQEILKKIEEL